MRIFKKVDFWLTHKKEFENCGLAYQFTDIGKILIRLPLEEVTEDKVVPVTPVIFVNGVTIVGDRIGWIRDRKKLIPISEASTFLLRGAALKIFKCRVEISKEIHRDMFKNFTEYLKAKEEIKNGSSKYNSLKLIGNKVILKIN